MFSKYTKLCSNYVSQYCKNIAERRMVNRILIPYGTIIYLLIVVYYLCILILSLTGRVAAYIFVLCRNLSVEHLKQFCEDANISCDKLRKVLLDVSNQQQRLARSRYGYKVSGNIEYFRRSFDNNNINSKFIVTQPQLQSVLLLES